MTPLYRRNFRRVSLFIPLLVVATFLDTKLTAADDRTIYSARTARLLGTTNRAASSVAIDESSMSFPAVPTSAPLHRRRAITFSLNYTSVYMFCYRDTYTRASSGPAQPLAKMRSRRRQRWRKKFPRAPRLSRPAAGSNATACPDGEESSLGLCWPKCKERFSGAGPACLQLCPSYGGDWVTCLNGCAPSTRMCLKKAYVQANSLSFLFLKVPLPGAGPGLETVQQVGRLVGKLLPVLRPSFRLRSSPDLPSIAHHTLASRTLAAIMIAAFGKPIDASSRHRGIVTLVPPAEQDKAAAFAAFRNTHLISHQPIRSTARRLTQELLDLHIVLNVEDLAKYDPSGLMNVVFAFGHPLCSDNNCTACYAVRGAPCLRAPSCNGGLCEDKGLKPDGTACTDIDWAGNAFSGVCQAGECSHDAVLDWYQRIQMELLWWPPIAGGRKRRRSSAAADAAEDGSSGSSAALAGTLSANASTVAAAAASVTPTLPAATVSQAPAPSKVYTVSAEELGVRIDPSVYKTSPDTYLSTSLRFWHDMASQGTSCTFNNGGCGALVCQLNAESKTTFCLDPHERGFAPAPMGLDFPGGETLSYHFPLSALGCMEMCKREEGCVMMVTSYAGECWVKGSVGDAVSQVMNVQAYKLIDG